jgi:hypothetical protein
MEMTVTKTHEAGYAQALHGLGLPKGLTSRVSPEAVAESLAMAAGGDTLGDRLIRVSVKCARAGNGHESYLELIQTWWLIRAPLFFWRQMDRYRMKSQISESTMHTLRGQELGQGDFLHRLDEAELDRLNAMIRDPTADSEAIAARLPNGFMQSRAVCANYRELAAIMRQRKEHKLGVWRTLTDEVARQVDHPELLT